MCYCSALHSLKVQTPACRSPKALCHSALQPSHLSLHPERSDSPSAASILKNLHVKAWTILITEWWRSARTPPWSIWTSGSIWSNLPSHTGTPRAGCLELYPCHPCFKLAKTDSTMMACPKPYCSPDSIPRVFPSFCVPWESSDLNPLWPVYCCPLCAKCQVVTYSAPKFSWCGVLQTTG